MKLFHHAKDGGKDSPVDGYWLIEIKGLFSIALLRFAHGSRENFHSHAFDCISWILNRGQLREEHRDGRVRYWRRHFLPIVTLRSTFHRVFSIGTTWVLTFRGPWSREWLEYDPRTDEMIRLTHGRREVARWPA